MIVISPAQHRCSTLTKPWCSAQRAQGCSGQAEQAERSAAFDVAAGHAGGEAAAGDEDAESDREDAKCWIWARTIRV